MFELITTFYFENNAKRLQELIRAIEFFFDDTLANAVKLKTNEVYCLSRWDIKENLEIQLHNNPKSQDAWIFKCKLTNDIGKYYMGILGCDNRFASELSKSKLSLINPALDVKAFHIHISQIRNYKIHEKIIGEYKYIFVSALRNKIQLDLFELEILYESLYRYIHDTEIKRENVLIDRFSNYIKLIVLKLLITFRQFTK